MDRVRIDVERIDPLSLRDGREGQILRGLAFHAEDLDVEDGGDRGPCRLCTHRWVALYAHRRHAGP